LYITDRARTALSDVFLEYTKKTTAIDVLPQERIFTRTNSDKQKVKVSAKLVSLVHIDLVIEQD
jgi:hypothetical protein